jgi:hypothetical protein
MKRERPRIGFLDTLAILIIISQLARSQESALILHQSTQNLMEPRGQQVQTYQIMVDM